MADFAIAHALHVLAVILWIGGVGFVTLVVIPTLYYAAHHREYRSEPAPAGADIGQSAI